MPTRTLVALLAAGALLAGCSKEEPPADANSGSLGDSLKNAAQDAGDAAKKAADETTEAVKDAADELKDSAGDAADKVKETASGQFQELKARAVAEAEDRMTQVQSELDQLQAKLDKAAEPIKATVQPLMDTARQKLAAIGPKIDQLKTAGAETWQNASTELTEAIDSFQKSVRELASKLGG